MTNINEIPIDAWVIILRFINKQNLIETFNILFAARAINIPRDEKLNTFWIVVSQSRFLDDVQEFDRMPDAYESKIILGKLKEMGINENRAYEVVRQANSNLDQAFQILGWN